MSLSKSVLKKLSNYEVIALPLEYQNKFDSILTNINKEISELRQNYEKMQSELCVSRQVSSKLRQQIFPLERQCWTNCQYFRRECLELSSLPESMQNSELEDTALQLLKKLDVEIDSSNIEDCHWLPSKGPKRVVVKFFKRKDTNRIRKVKKNLKGMDLSSIGIRSSVYINDSLGKYYNMVWRKCRKLCVNKFIHSFWVSNGFIRLKLSHNERSYIITHINNFEELLPGNKFIRDEK